MVMHNLTPHEIVIIDADNSIKIRFPSDGVARASSYRMLDEILTVDGVQIPINKTTFGEVMNLPEQKDGHGYIVSVLTAQAAPGRTNLYITDDAVRDESGRIIGCRGLARV